MRFLPVFGCLVFLLALCGPLRAEESARQPDTLTVGTGWFDIFRDTAYRSDADIRMEYRWGLSLLSAANPALKAVDPYFQFRPHVVVETTARSSYYAGGGFIFDFLLVPYFVFSPSITVGFYSQGEGKRLGSPIEFRSTAEAGFRLDNGLRITAYVSHTSNAELTYKNPGAEMAGGYVHIPLTLFSGK